MIEVSLKNVEELVSLSSNSFLPSKKDGYFDALKFCQKFEDRGVLKIFVSKINNQIIGYISIILDKENNLFDIGPMHILPQYSGKGYGKKQVEFIINFAKENNYQKIETRTWGKNIGSNNIFNFFGFKKIKEILNDRIDGDSSVIFEKII